MHANAEKMEDIKPEGNLAKLDPSAFDPIAHLLKGVAKYAWVTLVIAVILFGVIGSTVGYVKPIYRAHRAAVEAKAKADAEAAAKALEPKAYSMAKGEWSPKLNPDYPYTADQVAGRKVRINGMDSRVMEWPIGVHLLVPSDAAFIEISSTDAGMRCAGIPYRQK